MDNSDQLLARKTLVQLQDETGHYPKLKRTFKQVQSALLLLSLPLMSLRGVGLVILALDLLWYGCDHTYRIRNQTNNTVFLMSRTDYRHYRQLTRN